MDETACLDHAEVKLLRAIFVLALVVHPEQLDYERLLRELGPSKATAVEAAVRHLRRLAWCSATKSASLQAGQLSALTGSAYDAMDGPPLFLLASKGRKKFARNLHEIRTWRGLTEKEVADGCQFAASEVRALERAQVEPESADLVKLATVLCVSVNPLLTGIKAWDFRPRDCPTARELSEIEDGDRDARLAHLVLIASALEVLPAALVKGTVWRAGVLYFEGRSVQE